VILTTAGLLFLPAGGTAVGASTANCTRTSVAMTPLTDFTKKQRYHGYHGGLYANTRDTPSLSYLKLGLAAAKRIHPIDGRIVLLSIGMSNTTQEFSTFVQLANADPRKSPDVTVVDGAQGGQDAEIIKNPAAPFWRIVDSRLAAGGATAAQVQAVWLKEAIANESEPFPQDALRLEADLKQIVAILRTRYSNLQQIFISSRTYGGYATTRLNPEPFAYESAFAVKWLVQQRVAGRLDGPWLGWGPYLWTNGERGRRDGLIWTCADVRPADGTHPSASGRMKVAQLLRQFFTGRATTRGWFDAR
jgi:hypothetical protein